MKFLRGFLLCFFVTSILIILIEKLTIQPNSLGLGGFIVIIYVPPVSFVGCLFGELLQFIFTKVKIKITIIQFLSFVFLGFICGLGVIRLFFYAVEDMSLPLVATLGSVSFYVGRNFPWKSEGN